MHHHFNLKSFIFYGTMIGSVVLLFKGVTAYGESQLKAPHSIGGDYAMKLENPPECLKKQNLVLKIEQSGVYIFAKLALKKTEPHLDPINLQGRLENQQMILSGSLNPWFFCTPDSFSTANELTLKGSFQEKTLTGQLETQTLSNLIQFQAKLSPVFTSEKQTH
ncbi:MAG: hypothetical protein ACKPFC_08425 [Planktothrix sp.]|uniref:hypothetical protein n=2 Tax=Planktothrix sp. TaxID=3088171 RepID=UPI0038D4999C